ncbi:MAG: nucleoside hydrolase [Bryobacterales bacterium]|nr:nucleoside hydrolase [Bryobacterales bacterium]
MQATASERRAPPVGIVLDCDMGNAIDDALALAMLYGFSGKNDAEARLVSVSVTKSNLQAAAFCDAMALFYRQASFAALEAAGGPKLPDYLRRRRGLPIGYSDTGWMSEDSPMLAGPLSRRDATGEPLYPHEVEDVNDTAMPGPLMRNALTAQHDQNCVVVLTGPATNLAELLDVPNAKPIIEAKVKVLVMMGGAYPAGQPEFNIKSDIAAARRVFLEWPTPIVASGYEVGRDLLFPAESIETDFAWAPNHPVVDAYRAHEKMPYDAPTWDVTAALYAVRPEAGYFQLSDPGTISVLDDGRTRFTASPEGRRSYLILDPAQKAAVIQTYRKWVSAQPDPPRRRR